MTESRSPSALKCQREAFSLPPDLHYLNCAFMSPLPKAVEAAGFQGMVRKRNPAGFQPEDFFLDAEAVRGSFAALVKAPDPRAVAIIPSVSYGIGIAARNTRLEAGQNIVLLHEQFPGNVYGWQGLAKERNAEIRVVRGEEGRRRGESWNARILEAIDSGTGLVAMAPVHWTDGTAFDLRAIGARAREVGASFVLDGTQSVGALPLDIMDVKPDALLVAAYKWLFGPYSIGLAYLGDRYLGGRPLEETWIAREGSDDFRNLVAYRDEYLPGAIRFDVGERSNFVLLPMLKAALELVTEWGPERIQSYTGDLAAPLLDEARDLGYSVESDRYRVNHLFGLRMPSQMPLETLRTALDQERVSVSLRGSALRVSPNVYNRPEDLEALVRALRATAGT